MPVISTSTYRAPFGFANAHVQSILPRLIRRQESPTWRRDRIETDDGDDLDLDWSTSARSTLAVISYGMEGSPRGDYTVGMARALLDAGRDVLVWNYRGCGGEPNRKIHFYHGGLTGDLHRVITHAADAGGYGSVELVGFSLGGNLVLNYLGHRGSDVPNVVKRAVAISAPVDVADCARALKRPGGGLYVRRFLRFFRSKIRAKAARGAGISDEGFDDIRTLEDYDARYTVPHFGLGTWQNFYRFVSSRHVLRYIRVPTLIINAKDDPFLGPDCFPESAASENPSLFLETPEHGGHLGFLTWPINRSSWLEKRAITFLEEAARGGGGVSR